MFFDEGYSEEYYRYQTIKIIEDRKTDCLLVVGTALATSGARSFVFNTLKDDDKPVIEINLEPQCKVGFSFNVIEKSETALNTLFDEYYRLMD